MSKKKDHTADHFFNESDQEMDMDSGEAYSLADALDVEILMHRDAHFGGQFPVMLEYYRNEGKGANPEFEIPRIEELQRMEQESGENLAALLLTGPDAERVAKTREAYRKLREVAESTQKGKPTHAQLLAHLILSEDSELTKEVAAIVAAGKDIVPALIQMIQSDDYYDPLFPGYGLAPTFAAHCLGKLGDERAIPILFGCIGKSDFFNEDTLCQALHAIGAPARTFLLKIVQGRPLNEDNVCAALALSYFDNDPEVAKACLQQLQQDDVLKNEPLATYLLMACFGLQSASERKAFADLTKRKDFPESLKRDAKTIFAQWG
jgi:hypothetical protein